jgi:hypothetical protein
MSRYSQIKAASAEVIDVRLMKKTSIAKAHAAIRDMIVSRPRGAGTPARRHKSVNGGI